MHAPHRSYARALGGRWFKVIVCPRSKTSARRDVTKLVYFINFRKKYVDKRKFYEGFI